MLTKNHNNICQNLYNPNIRTSQPQKNAQIGTYRVKNYRKDELTAKMMQLPIIQKMSPVIPSSISMREETLHLSLTELRTEDYYLIRTKKISHHLQMQIKKAVMNKAFNEKLIDQFVNSILKLPASVQSKPQIISNYTNNNQYSGHVNSNPMLQQSTWLNPSQNQTNSQQSCNQRQYKTNNSSQNMFINNGNATKNQNNSLLLIKPSSNLTQSQLRQPSQNLYQSNSKLQQQSNYNSNAHQINLNNNANPNIHILKNNNSNLNNNSSNLNNINTNNSSINLATNAYLLNNTITASNNPNPHQNITNCYDRVNSNINLPANNMSNEAGVVNQQYLSTQINQQVPSIVNPYHHQLGSTQHSSMQFRLYELLAVQQRLMSFFTSSTMQQPRSHKIQNTVHNQDLYVNEDIQQYLNIPEEHHTKVYIKVIPKQKSNYKHKQHSQHSQHHQQLYPRISEFIIDQQKETIITVIYQVQIKWIESPKQAQSAQGKFQIHKKTQQMSIKKYLRQILQKEYPWIRHDAELSINPLEHGGSKIEFILQGNLQQKKINLPKGYHAFPKNFQKFKINNLTIVSQFGSACWLGITDIEAVDFSHGFKLQSSLIQCTIDILNKPCVVNFTTLPKPVNNQIVKGNLQKAQSILKYIVAKTSPYFQLIGYNLVGKQWSLSIDKF